MLPVSEITHFPSVLVRLDGRNSKVLDEFSQYVRPTLNPLLTQFSIELTAITQEMVDNSNPLPKVMEDYMSWLRQHGLVNRDGERLGRWGFCTWSDADIGSQLTSELRYKHMAIPPCFDKWVDLKPLYRQHYRKETNGLQRSVEALGIPFKGRAHDGLVDSQNTAAIVLHMVQGSALFPAYVFRRYTRGLDAQGNPFGSKRSNTSSNRARKPR